MNRVKLVDIVYSVYKECNINSFPVDCFKILEHYHFKIKTYSELHKVNPELYRLCISCSNDAFSNIGTYFIAYNDKANPRRIRFSLMHELGHFVLGHTGRTQENEDEADCFASYILAPRVSIRRNEFTTADEIHDYFDISYAAANRTLLDYKKWCAQKQSEADSELNIWLYYPNFYRHRENHRKNRARRLRQSKRAWKKTNKRIGFLMQNLSDYDEYVWAEHENHLYNV